MSIVSTDRYRVVLKNLEIKIKKTVEGKNTGMHNYLINPKGLQLLNSILEEEEDVILEFEKDLLWIASANKKIAIRYGEGDYPDYNKIIPQSFACSFLLNTKEALSALKQVYISARANVNNKSVKMEVDPENQKIKFLSEAPDGYSSESNCALSNYEGGTEAWSQYFNIDYLIDYLSTLQVESFLWEANPGRPSVLSPENQKSTELYLVSGLQK
jgi:DNA polymerase-3 subunit beta